MARIILHIGTHKTGTTGLQRSLFAQRDMLKENGICYDPWPGVLWGLEYAHHGLAHRLARFEADDQKVLADYKLRIERALTQGQDVIISAEPFYRQVAAGMPGDPDSARICFMDRLADYFEGLPVEVSICFRRPDRMAESLYKEHGVNTDNKLGFLPWLDKFADRFDYTARLAEFEQRFGPAKVWCFEDAMVKGLLSVFFEEHQLEVSNFENAKADRKSISARAVEWLLSAKRGVENMSVSERHIRWYYAASKHAHSALVHGRGETFWPEVESRDRFLRAALADFRHADFWNQPAHEPKQISLTEGDQNKVEKHFQKWVRVNRILLKMRKKARLAPYDADDAIPLRIKMKYLPERLWAGLWGG